MRANKKIFTLRLHPRDIDEIKRLSSLQRLSQTALVERALHRMFWECEEIK